MAELAFTRRGAGTPLVLLHGIGSARHAWDPVIDTLAEQFDVLAIDLPGFRDSPPLPSTVEPLPTVLAASVADFLDERGVTTPGVAGNSIGGWVALELAGIRPIASLALLSPPGCGGAGRRRTTGSACEPSPLESPRTTRAWQSGHGHLPRFRRHHEATEPRCYLSGSRSVPR
jgi:pimeloyl-ACP methyl ester carboxylesterase